MSTPPSKLAGTAKESRPPVQSNEAAAAVQAERRRIAQALHDTVSQTMTGAYLQALVTARKLQGDGSHAAGDVAELAESIHRAVVELQNITRQLQPDPETPPD